MMFCAIIIACELNVYFATNGFFKHFWWFVCWWALKFESAWDHNVNINSIVFIQRLQMFSFIFVTIFTPSKWKHRTYEDPHFRGHFAERWSLVSIVIIVYRTRPFCVLRAVCVCMCMLVLKAIRDAEKVSFPQMSDVLDAYEHALLGVYPRARYVVGYDARFFWLPLQALPEWLGDWIMECLNTLFLSTPASAVIKNHH